MGAGASANAAAPFESVEAALAAGKTQDEVDAWTATQGETKEAVTETPAADAEAKPADAEAAPAESTAATPAEAEATATDAEAAPAEEAPKAAEIGADGIDRSEIERNKNGSEEPTYRMVEWLHY